MNKIDSLGLSTPSSAVSSVGSRPAKSTGGTSSSVSAKSGSQDTVNLTDDAMQLQDVDKSVSRGPSVDVKRVAALRQSIANGTYTINADSIATKLLSMDRTLGQG
jgi:negative regulator of flagellin synthesis FlgM